MADPRDWERIVNNFFVGFMVHLDACNPSRIENNIQNINEYNRTRENCQQVFRYFVPNLERMVEQIERVPPTANTVGLIDLLIPRINRVLNSAAFENIEQTSQPAQPEFGIEGHQGRSELSLVNHYERLHYLMTRLIERRDAITGYISSGGRKKRKKSMEKKRSSKKKKNTKKRRRMY